MNSVEKTTALESGPGWFAMVRDGPLVSARIPGYEAGVGTWYGQ